MSHGLVSRICSVVVLLWIALSLAACGGFVGDNRHNVPLSSAAKSRLAAIGSSPAEPMLVRVFKEEDVLEVWKRTSSGRYALFKTYEICAWSGELGPKFREGDHQAPEGIYTVTPALMHPGSNYHLAFNTGFPNKFDRAHNRTGSHLMVHGDCLSVGCYAMTDAGIAEIYALARESFAGGNRQFQLQLFPFRMTPENLARHAASPHLAFWQNLKEGYDLFELTRTPPLWDVCEGRYVFDAPGDGQLAAMGPCPAYTRSPELVARQQSDQAAFEVALARVTAAKQRTADADRALADRTQNVHAFFGGVFGR